MPEWRGFCDHHRRDGVCRQNIRGHGTKRLAQKPRIASDDYSRTLFLLSGHVTRDSTHRAPTLAKVNSSAITARHPEVPNLICIVIFSFSSLAATLSDDTGRQTAASCF